MKRNTYRNRSIVFGCVSLPFVIAFVVTAAKGELTLNAIPATVGMLILMFFCVFYAVKHNRYIKENYADELRAKKEARKHKRKVIMYKMKFRRTRKMGFIWLDDKHMMFKTRFTFVPLIFLYSELVDYKVNKGKRRYAYTRFYSDRRGIQSATTTFGNRISYFNLVLILTGGRKKVYHMLHDYYLKRNLNKKFAKTTEALECIRDYNRGYVEPERARVVIEFDVF